MYLQYNETLEYKNIYSISKVVLDFMVMKHLDV